MKTLHTLIKIAIFANIGVFIGSSLYTWCGYFFQMNLYLSQAVPWYLLILIRGVFTAGTVLVLLVLLFFMKKKM